MNWRDRLLPASFRGVGFWIDQAKSPVGRKGQLHEYPQRDLPYFEDLGQQAKTHDITAFIIGADCLEQRDKLLKALEQGRALLDSIQFTPKQARDAGIPVNLDGARRSAFVLLSFPDVTMTQLADAVLHRWRSARTVQTRAVVAPSTIQTANIDRRG